jgi:hypothetical protein
MTTLLLFGMALQANDTAGAAAVFAAVVVATVACHPFVPGRPAAELKRFAVTLVLGLSGFTLVMVNWHMYEWLAASADISLDAARRRIPL